MRTNARQKKNTIVTNCSKPVHTEKLKEISINKQHKELVMNTGRNLMDEYRETFQILAK